MLWLDKTQMVETTTRAGILGTIFKKAIIQFTVAFWSKPGMPKLCGYGYADSILPRPWKPNRRRNWLAGFATAWASRCLVYHTISQIKIQYSQPKSCSIIEQNSASNTPDIGKNHHIW
jgi:hypothetical protein